MNKKRPHQMSFRVSDEEYEMLKKKIAESGLSNQEYILRAVLDCPIVGGEQIRQITASLLQQQTELKKQGGNLNQLVSKLNARGYIDYKNELPQALETLKKAQEGVTESWQLLKQYLHTLQ